MNSSLTVSIVITSYNKGKLLHRAIQSLDAQSYSNFEIIIVDDCSTNQDTIEILNILETESRYKIIRNQENMGPGFTKNRGIEIANGEIIISLDSDDTLPPDAVQQIITTFDQNPESGFVFGNYEKHFIKEERIEHVNCSNLTQNNILQPGKLIEYWTLLGSSPFRKSAWQHAGGFNTIHRVSDDVDFFKKMMLLEIQGTYINHNIYNWFFNRGSGVNTSGAKFDFWLAKLRMIDFEFKYSKQSKFWLLAKVSFATLISLLLRKRKVNY